MCLFTHFAAGALAGGLTGNVYLGLAAGVASHAVLDVIPHYDHPDWRLDLGGGILSLLLLLVMPFASWPAVLGGLGGMLPDLENLFQKLGKMRRDQFVFPTHTGLLPHGRTLGPRTLGWQAAIFAGCFLLLGALTPGQALAADAGQTTVMGQPVVRVLEAGSERTVLRVDFPALQQPADWQTVDPLRVQWALPLYVDDAPPAVESEDAVREIRTLPPRMHLRLAVPTRQELSWEVQDVQWWKEPTDAAAVRDANALVAFSRPVVSRSVPLSGTELQLAPAGGILRSLTVAVQHRAAGPQREFLNLAAQAKAAAAQGDAEWQDWRPESSASVANPELFEALSRGSRQQMLLRQARGADKAQVPDLFALTGHWVKLNLTETGLYRVTGQQLANFGVATTTVDPAKLRLYRGGGLPLDANPEVPDSLQISRVGLNEIAIEVVGAGDGEWNLDDEIRFYGVGSSTWLDRLDPAGARLEHFDHPYAAEAVYWVTWEDELTPSPLPGAPRRALAVNAAPTGGVQQATGRLRLHREEQFLDTPGLVQDNWVWDNTIFAARSEAFNLRAPVPGSSARYQVDLRGVYTSFSNFVFDVQAYLNTDEANAGAISFTFNTQSDSLRMRLVGDSSVVNSGANLITIKNVSDSGRQRPVALDSYDILYWTGLELTAGKGQLEFAHWGDQVAAPGTAVDLIVTAPVGGVPLMWDVSDPAAAQVWSGSAGTGNSYTFGVLRSPDTNRHFVATAAADLRTVVRGSRVFPVSLRSRGAAWDYVVVHPAVFTVPAQELAAFHSGQLVGVPSPAATAVLVDDIYDNFAGGQKDPRAIRNFLRWAYGQGAQRLRYVCLLGNASRDFRNYRARVPLVDLYDLVSTELRTSFPANPSAETTRLAYASDDGLVSFDNVATGDYDFPDVACGRLPALNLAEARAMVTRSIDYVRDPAPGLWRNRVLMTSDDLVRPSSYPNPTSGEYAHIRKAEEVAVGMLPASIDQVKVYGADYDFPPGSAVKPGARADLNAQLSAGTTMFYYVGHGAEDNLADEQIFQSRDIPNLTNGMMRPFFIAFSCDVGVFDSPSRRSMAEQFLQFEAGGAIGTICASQVSFISYNNALTDAFFSHQFPAQHIDPNQAVATSLRQAKVDMTATPSYRTNSQRYNLFGDPGMKMPWPVDDLSFAPASLDTVRAGARQVAVLAADGKLMLGAGDTYSLRVEESALMRRFRYSSTPAETTFIKPGAPVFVGSGTAGSGDLVIPFKVPVQLRYGDRARVRLLIESPDGDHVAVARVPAVRSAIGPNDDVIGPAINLGFQDNRYRVKPGAELVAALTDSSGIAILGTSPGNSLLLELDDSGFMADVTGSFAYDPDSYTSGRLVFPLPNDLEHGRHLAALHASDALGNVGSDTLSFEIVATSVTDIFSVTVFPNPTPGFCRLVFDLSDPMEVQWDIYTVAGSRLRSIRAALGAGPQILEWDGRDGRNDEIANGTYIYVLRGLGAAADGREIRKTGKLVVMR